MKNGYDDAPRFLGSRGNALYHLNGEYRERRSGGGACYRPWLIGCRHFIAPKPPNVTIGFDGD